MHRQVARSTSGSAGQQRAALPPLAQRCARRPRCAAAGDNGAPSSSEPAAGAGPSSSSGSNGAAFGGDAESASSGARFLRYNKDLPLTHHKPEGGQHMADSELPEHLRDLKLGDDGLLIDGKTGKVVNAFGATRLDVKLAALRGDLDPKPWEENTERAPGVLLNSLLQWPAPYTFQVVGANPGGCPAGEHAAFCDDVLATVSRLTEVALPLADDAVKRRPRLGGKYVSLAITVSVRAPEIITKVAAELQADPRVKMAF